MSLRLLKVLPTAAALTFLVIGFQNCGAARFTQDEGPASMKALDNGDATYVQDDDSSNDGDTPNHQPPVPNDYDIAYSGACSVFKDTEVAVQIPESAVDINASRNSSAVVIEVAKNVVLDADSASVLVKAAATATLDRMSGSLTQVSAIHIPSATRVSGALCLRAESIGGISQLSGGSRVIAREIEMIYQNSATLHIYGAVVKNVVKSSGKICLHDGATILNQSDNSGLIVSDCK